jgi:hypothetical protein
MEKMKMRASEVQNYDEVLHRFKAIKVVASRYIGFALIRISDVR